MRQQRPNQSLALELFIVSGAKEISGRVPCFPAAQDFGVRKFGASFNSLDHAVD
jgi:hypothetical protein